MTRWHLRYAVHVLRRGGVVAYPTEAVYGLGCDPLDALAVARILALKGRPVAKGLILIGACYAQFCDLVLEPDPAVARRLRAPRLRPTTWLLPARSGVPAWLTGSTDRLAVRVTRHPDAAALCRAFGGPLVSTSANPSGRPAARRGLAVRGSFGDRLDFIVPGRCGGGDRESEIRDARSGQVVRA